MRLQLGSLNDIRRGWVNHDIVKHKGIDVTHDLDRYPWPWKTGSCEEIYICHCLEHLDDPFRAIDEMLRILKRGGIITIKVPYYNSPNHYDNADHKTAFGRGWFTTIHSFRKQPYKYEVFSVVGTPTILGKMILPIRLKKDYTLRDYLSTVFGNVYWEITATIKKK